MKIVIAEDDAISRLILRKTLIGLNFDVVATEDGADAWEYLRANDARILITDWMMPRLDGLELCRKVRLRAPGPYVYIILITSLDRREDRLKALQAGADDFLAKPLDKSELFARINVARRIVDMEDQLRRRSADLERMHGELERRNAQLAEIATSDGLTGLKNHRYFREALEAQFSLTSRRGGPLSLLMIDVDQFKPFNDSFGHPAGDEVLREVARLLVANVRGHDVVARYGGEEFAVLLPATDADASLALGQRLRAAIEGHDWPLRPVTISLGVATSCGRTPRAADMIDWADRSLYQSKAQGRNRLTHARELSDQMLADTRRRPPHPPDAHAEAAEVAPFALEI